MADKKVVIVTGANSGVGLETAKGLCELGHEVIISVRDDEKGKAALSNIKDEVPKAEVDYFVMELSDTQSIRNFVDKFLATGKPLHVLINNAGLFKNWDSKERTIARDDPALEQTMTVNCMGSFLLANLLLEKLKATATETEPARIVNVSSLLTIHKAGQRQVGFFIDDIMLAEPGHYMSGLQSYRNSKLALNLWTNELAKKLEGSNVVANTVCPGFIPSTALVRENKTSLKARIMFSLMDSFLGRWLVQSEPVSSGRHKFIRMATASDRTTSGKFYVHDKETPEAAEVLNEENQRKIWDLCVKYSGL